MIGLRLRLLSATLAPVALVAALALAGVQGAPLAGGVLFAALAIAGGVVALTAPFERLRRAAAESLRRAGLADSGGHPAGPGDGTGEISHTVAALLDELALARVNLDSRDRQFHAALTTATTRLTALARDYRQPMAALQLDSPGPRRIWRSRPGCRRSTRI